MRAQVLTAARHPLAAAELPVPRPGPQQVLIAVRACAVCRTDLHVVDGELPDPKLPLVPGHEIIGTVVEKGNWSTVSGSATGSACRGSAGHAASATIAAATARICATAPRFTGYQIDGGYAELTVADQRYCFVIDPPLGRRRGGAPDVRRPHRLPHAAHGRRCPADRHLRLWRRRPHRGAGHPPSRPPAVRLHPPGRPAAQDFARSLGAEWAGGSDQPPPEPLDAALIFAPVGALVPAALAATKKGGTVVSGGIHMSDIPSFPYRILWEERVLRSVANLTRRDAEEFLALAPEAGIRTETVTYPLARANDALADLRNGALQGAAVLIP